jgi:hypothetical protein
MELEENVDYTRTGWREGEVATLDNRPRLGYTLEAWNAAPDKAAWNTAFAALSVRLIDAHEAALTDEQKAERAAAYERKALADAAEFYRNRPVGSHRSFWD